jgi:uncharacterized protein YcfJ
MSFCSIFTASFQGCFLGASIGTAILPGVGSIAGSFVGSIFGTFGGIYCTDRIVQNVSDSNNYDIVVKNCEKCGEELKFKKYLGETVQNLCEKCSSDSSTDGFLNIN